LRILTYSNLIILFISATHLLFIWEGCHCSCGRWDANKEIGDVPALYNSDITEKGDPEKAIRIFLNKPEKGERRPKPVHRKHTISTKTMDTYTQMEHALKEKPQGQVLDRIFCLEDETKNHTLRITGPSQTNQRGELIAIVQALIITPKVMC